MKTQFSRRPNIFISRTRLGLMVLGVLVVLVLFLRLVFPSALYALMTPLWYVGDSFSSVVSVGEDAKKLKEERDMLKEQNEALVHENQTLTDQLSQAGMLPADEGILVSVLSRPPVSPYDVLIINAGTKEGVVPGAVVFARGGVPVGKIQDAGLGEARVVLYSSPLYETEGWIGEDRNPITIVGEGAGAVRALVPHELPVQEGDVLYLPGSSVVGYGNVVQVIERASSPQKEVHIRPYINPFTLTAVMVDTLP